MGNKFTAHCSFDADYGSKPDHFAVAEIGGRQFAESQEDDCNDETKCPPGILHCLLKSKIALDSDSSGEIVIVKKLQHSGS
jgi:hypothetical protein